ncbi:hypothetical protein PF010_g15870 [Phytophthora fragariae]|nr:hypothetical protein PF010_g15870 [Phytophthora fragariae]
MRETNFSRNPEKTVKSAGVLDLIHSDVMDPMQTKTPGGCTYAVTSIDDFSRHVTVYFMKKKAEVLEKFKMFKADMENATGRKIKRIHSDNGGEYTGRLFKEYLSKQGIRHEKTVPYTPRQNGLAERMKRSLVEMARCILYNEGIDKKWWAEAVNTSAWIINRISYTVTVKTPYEIVYQKKPQLKNLKVFGALGYGHIPDEKRRKLDTNAFKCRFMGYEDGVKGYRVLNVATGQVKIVRTVKFMETTNTDDFMAEVEGDDKDGNEDVAAPRATAPSRGQSQTLTIFNDEVVPLQHEVTTETAIVPAPSHSMITRSRTRHIEETTDPEEAEGRKKQIVAPSAIETKRQKVSQDRVKPSNELLAIEGGQLMAATEEVPKTYAEATTRQDQDEWKKAIARELESLIANKTSKLVPKPAHQRPIGCRWVFALKRDEKGQAVRYKTRLVAKGYSQRHGIYYEETYSPVAYLNSVRAMLAKCGAEGMGNTSCRVSSRGSPIVSIWRTISLNWSTCTANRVPDSILKLCNFLVTRSRFLSVFRLNCASIMRHESAAVVAPRMQTWYVKLTSPAITPRAFRSSVFHCTVEQSLRASNSGLMMWASSPSRESFILILNSQWK